MKKKTTAQKKRAGTYRPDKANGHASNFTPIALVPAPPAWLSEEGQKIYFSVTEDRRKAGLLFDADIDLFVAYARETSTYLQMCEDIANEGEIITDKNKDPRRNPKILIASKALEQSMKLAKQLGIGVYGRDKIAPDRDPGQGPGAVEHRLFMLTKLTGPEFEKATEGLTGEEVAMLKEAIEDITILDKRPEFAHLRDLAAHYRLEMGFDEWSARYGEI